MIGIRHETYAELIDELPFSLVTGIERTPFNCSREKNWHENIEIQLCTQGSGTVLLDGERYTVSPGDIVVVNSNVVHYTLPEHYLRYTCLIVSTQWCRKMQIDYSNLRYSPVIVCAELEALIERLSEICADHSDPLRVAKANRLLLHLLITLSEQYASPRLAAASKNRYFDVIVAAIACIEKNYDRKVTLSELAESVYFNKYALCKEFKRYTGQTIIQYLHHYRSLKAIDYLSEGYTVAETAALCGFENLSFFTRTFKRCTGKNPSYYKKQGIGEPVFLPSDQKTEK